MWASDRTWRALLLAVVMSGSVWSVGCATGRSSRDVAPDPTDDQVMYSPPEDAEQPIAIPRGAPVREEYARPVAEVQGEPPAEAQAGEVQGTEVTREVVESMVAMGPGWGLSHVQVKPVQGDDGALLGFEISAFSAPAAQLLSPPLRTGDRITHINGVKIRTPDDFMEAWNLSRTVSELRIDYVRDGVANYSSWSVVE